MTHKPVTSGRNGLVRRGQPVVGYAPLGGIPCTVFQFSDDGLFVFSNGDQFEFSGCVAAPGVPLMVVGPGDLSSEALLVWTPDTGSNYTNTIERAPDGTSFAAIGSVDGEVEYTDTGLSADTQYWYRVKANNHVGASGYSNADDITIQATAPNADPAQTIPTYDGSGQSVHPDVYDAGLGSTWNGHRYWMALTPFPAGASAFENPSILTGDDGNTWAVPAGGSNPIDPAPGAGNNADCDLIVGQDNVMYCYYMEWVTPTGYIRVRSSADGVTWSAESALWNENYIASPAVLWDGAQYVMYYVSWAAEPPVLKRRTCATPTGVWSAAATCTVNGIPTGHNLWHLDVIRVGGEYHAAVVISLDGQHPASGPTKLIVGKSTDGTTFTLHNAKLLKPKATKWDDKNIYRGTIVYTDPTHHEMWYSAEKLDTTWHIGRTTIVGAF